MEQQMPTKGAKRAASENRIKEILDWYKGDNAGTLTNLARMLNHGILAGTGNMVILPVDQGFEHGPARSFASNAEAYNPHYHFQLAIDAGCNAYAAPLGFLEAGAADFAVVIDLSKGGLQIIILGKPGHVVENATPEGQSHALVG